MHGRSTPFSSPCCRIPQWIEMGDVNGARSGGSLYWSMYHKSPNYSRALRPNLRWEECSSSSGNFNFDFNRDVLRPPLKQATTTGNSHGRGCAPKEGYSALSSAILSRVGGAMKKWLYVLFTLNLVCDHAKSRFLITPPTVCTKRRT